MRSLLRLLLSSLLIATPALAHQGPRSWSGTSSAGLNVPSDTNGDGYFDLITVGDYDGDGTLEMADIQAAHDALRISTDETATKPDLTVRIGTTPCDGAAQCVKRTLGSFVTDGFVSGTPVWISGFPFYTTGRAALGTATNTSCTQTGGGAAGPDCFKRTVGDFTTDGFSVGMTIYAYFFTGDKNGSSPISQKFVVAAVTATELEVDCPNSGITAGTTGCLTATATRPGRWLVSPGVNGANTVSGTVTATMLPLASLPPKEEQSTPTGQAAPTGSVNMPVVADSRPIVLKLVPGTYLAPGAAPTNSTAGILELTSFTMLQGAGFNSTVLRSDSDVTIRSAISGPRLTDYPGAITNVEVADLEIDGGWDVGANTVHAIGFDMGGFQLSAAKRLRVHDTGHACVHLFNASWNRVDEVRCFRAGNWAGIGTATKQAAFYNYAGQLTKASISIGNEWWNDSVSFGQDAFHFRREAATDELARVYVQGATVSDMNQGYTATIKGSRDLVIDGLRATHSGPIVFDTSAAAFGDLASSRGTVLRNIDMIDGSITTTSASGVYIANFHDKVTIENLHIKGGSGGSAVACLYVTAPVRSLTIRNAILEDCGLDGMAVAGASAGLQYEAGDMGWKLDNFTIRGVDDDSPFTSGRSGFTSSVDLYGLRMRNWRIEGASSSTLLFSGSSTCYGCEFTDISFYGGHPRFIGRGLNAWAATVACDVGHENYWLVTTNATGSTVCTFSGSGGSTVACACDGNGTWTNVSAVGANAPVMSFTGGLHESVLRNIIIKDCRDANAIQLAGVVQNNVFENIRVENEGILDNLANSCKNGLQSDANASNSGNHLSGLSCARGISSGKCFAWNAGAEPSGAAGSYDDFDYASQFPVEANPGAAVCTTGQIAQTLGTDALDVCEAAAWVNK